MEQIISNKVRNGRMAVKISTGFLLLTGFLFSCKKNPPPDYRERFAGTYVCHKTGDSGCINSLVSVDASVKIGVALRGDSSIRLLDADIAVEANGRFGKNEEGSNCLEFAASKYRILCGSFKEDSLYLDLYDGGLGCYSDFTYVGVKE